MDWRGLRIKMRNNNMKEVGPPWKLLAKWFPQLVAWENIPSDKKSFVVKVNRKFHCSKMFSNFFFSPPYSSSSFFSSHLFPFPRIIYRLILWKSFTTVKRVFFISTSALWMESEPFNTSLKETFGSFEIVTWKWCSASDSD